MESSFQSIVPHVAQMQVKDREESGNLSLFERLPGEIRRKVYVQLLKADNVRQPPGDDLIRHYRFETAILGVNKRLYDDTWPILYRENHFVTVSCNWKNVFVACTNYQVATIAKSKPAAVAKFKMSVLRLHVNFPPLMTFSEPKEKIVKSFLMVADELPKFIRMQRILMVVVPKAIFKFIFRLQETSGGVRGLIAQNSVMEPFRCLCGNRRASMSYDGIIDPAYTHSLENASEPYVQWVRGTAWETYDLMASIKSVADDSFAKGCWNSAAFHYAASRQVLDAVYYQHSAVAKFPDEDWRNTVLQVFPVLQANALLVLIRDKQWDLVLKFERFPNFDLTRGRLHLYRAVALAAKHEFVAASTELRKASDAEPHTELLQRFTRIMSTHLAAKTPLEVAAADTIFSDKSLSQLNDPFQLLPPVKNPSVKTTQERYVLHQLGYRGDYLPSIKDTNPVNVSEANRLLQSIEEQKASRPSDKPFTIWIGEFPKVAWLD